MKRFFSFILLLLFIRSISTAQLINVNPNKNAEPWYAGGFPAMTPEKQAEYDSIPKLDLTQESKSKTLPVLVDNSQYIFMRPVFRQDSGSCAQASGVSYIFTYEVNRLRNTPADTSHKENLFTYNYTYNYLNSGSGNNGSFYWDGWDIIKANGCPTIPTWGGLFIDCVKHMDKFSDYQSGQQYRVKDRYRIDFKTEAGINALKHWLSDHNGDGIASGGLAAFAANVTNNIDWMQIPSGTYANKWMVKRWGDPTGCLFDHNWNHAMTFVGYDDNFAYDFNGDGVCTNNIDWAGAKDSITGQEAPDGVVDIKDWEIGAFKVVNSWGNQWPYPGGIGYIYMPYRTIYRMNDTTGVYQDGAGAVMVMDAQINVNPQIILKLKVAYENRSKITFKAGVADNSWATSPQFTMDLNPYRGTAGNFPMNGYNDSIVEISYDISSVLQQLPNAGKFFFKCKDFDTQNQWNGIIQSFSIEDHRYNPVFEIKSEDTNVVVPNNSYFLLPIDYDILPESVPNNYSITSNKCVRWNSKESFCIYINNDSRLDFYDGSLSVVSSGQASKSTLIYKTLTIRQKGTQPILLKGNINIQSGGRLILAQGSALNYTGGVEESNPVLTVKQGGVVELEANSHAELNDYSTVLLNTGGIYTINDGTTLTINGTCKLKMDACSKFVIKGTGKLIVKSGATLDIAGGAVILADNPSVNIVIESGVTFPAGSLQIKSATTISSPNQTWTGVNYCFVGNLNIETSAGLNLLNSQISFIDNAGITVKPGAKLIADSTHITSYSGCESSTWLGITLLGNATLPQTDTKQGVVEIINGAVIEKAICAVYAGNIDSPGDNSSGGIVRVDNALFKDCKTGIAFAEYHCVHAADNNLGGSNAGYIKNSRFETGEFLYNLGSYPQTALDLWAVEGVKISGNTFININPLADVRRGSGIRSSDAGFSASGNSFQNLSEAINVSGTGLLATCLINLNTFSANTLSIRLKANKSAEITQNNISLTDNVSSKTIGISLEYSSGFFLEDNTFTSSETINATGIYTLLDNKNRETIYGNEFTNVKYPVVSYQSPELRYECNRFLGAGHTAIYIDDRGASPSQGSTQMPAGNRFLMSPRFNDIFSKIDIISYFSEPENVPIYYNKKVGVFVTRAINLCPSHLDGSIVNLTTSQIDNQITAKTASLNSLLDGGNTEALVEIVENAENEEALKLRNKLLAESPDLSELVLSEAGASEDVLPSLMLTQVMENNPQAAKSNSVRETLENRENPLPDYLKNRIDSGITRLSPVEEIRFDISSLESIKYTLYHKKIGAILTDTINYDSLSVFCANNIYLQGAYMRLANALTQNKIPEAQNILISIETDFALSNQEQEEYQDVKTITEIASILKQAGKTWFELSAEQKTVLENLALRATQGAFMAQNVLSLVYGMVFTTEFITPDFDESNNKNAQPKPLVNEYFTAYPTHADDWFIVDYALNESEPSKDVEIALFDTKNTMVLNFEVKNRQDQLLAECRNLAAGIYTLRKSISNKTAAEITIEIGNEQNSTLTHNVDIQGDNQNLIFAVYPNPATTDVSVVWKHNGSEKADVRLQISDISGKLVRSEILHEKYGIKNLPINDLPKGIYTISLVLDNQVVKNEKLIVK